MANQPRLDPRFDSGDAVMAMRKIQTYYSGNAPAIADIIPAGARGCVLNYSVGREGWLTVDFGIHGVSDAHESELELTQYEPE